MSRHRHINRARKLRQVANKPEQAAWEALRGFRKHGFPVRRQHPIRGYTVDFAIQRARLVIEVDGASHASEAARARDGVRDAELRKAGWEVMRVPAELALDGEGVIRLVARRLGIL
ncbi:MAG: endonuclease domain-containing protein [Hyphomonadaceae bacterium]|nr:endonuclease domain-containing protein [Hyphomonadaceae bacterium]